ncbi:hypothetical protein DMH08_23215, partial [Actinomadura sp. WAC 06369]
MSITIKGDEHRRDPRARPAPGPEGETMALTAGRPLAAAAAALAAAGVLAAPALADSGTRTYQAV